MSGVHGAANQVITPHNGVQLAPRSLQLVWGRNFFNSGSIKSQRRTVFCNSFVSFFPRFGVHYIVAIRGSWIHPSLRGQFGTHGLCQVGFQVVALLVHLLLCAGGVMVVVHDWLG